MFTTTTSAGKKRSRVDDDEATLQSFSSPLEKRSRPTGNASGAPSPWLHRYHDSVLSTPTLSRSSTLGLPRSPPKYDSDDDENSSEISEPGSPQDISMSSGDEGEESQNDHADHYSLHPPRRSDEATFSASPPDGLYRTSSTDANGANTRSDSPNPWPSSSLPRFRQTNRVPTPIFPMRTKSTTTSPGGVRAHVRQRHPQEISHASSSEDPPTKSTNHLSVPSPILESADFPTPPPSAAEAAGSQLSQLSVSDVDMLDPGVPVIAIERVGSPEFAGRVHGVAAGGEGGGIVVRRQRMRSGALNGGERTGGRGGEGLKGLDGDGGGGGQGAGKRGFSIGYRPDCEKCRERVPGHMNHFWGP